MVKTQALDRNRPVGSKLIPSTTMLPWVYYSLSPFLSKVIYKVGITTETIP